ncbi:MAG: methylenetetrahydrofolate reductase C-terminal domain-containing protein [Dehalococcoidia bacterium]|nr:methylenetetrahydrofolate reductase C-terminal domain-containing protein [Dehalococcoidia bacterium]
MTRNRNILVVSKTPELAEITGKAMEGSVEVDYASNETEALAKIRATRPALVILGDMEPPGAVARFCRELRAGWISRHSSLLLVDLNPNLDSHRILGEEFPEEVIAEHDFLAGSSGAVISQESLLPRLKERIVSKLQEKENRLKASILDPHRFSLIWEQIPGLGAFEVRQEMVLENAGKAAKGERVSAISVTDNPGGNPAIATEILCCEISKLGVEPLVHLAFRDKGRNQCESLLYQLAAMEIHNLLVLTGDYPGNTGFEGTSRPVFDLDSVTGLRLISEMNRGMEHEIMRKKTKLAPTDFFAGVAFSPFKQEEAEVMGQYYKLEKKIEAGADFIITQVGYDVRKLHELQLWLKAKKHEIPVLTSIYVLPYSTAQAMNANHVPGCVVTDQLLPQLARESTGPDKGRIARLDRAAKMYAIALGLGFSGVYISGQGLQYEGLEYIVDKGQELLGRWPDLIHEFNYPRENGFYFFQADEKNGLNLEAPAARKQKAVHSPVYYLSRVIHALVFERASPLFKMLRPLFRSMDSRRTPRKVFGSFEYWSKAVLYGCVNCGDCALYDVAYLCPVSQCPKNQRNGPCGGSNNGWCEIYPNEKKCIWVRAYLRLKAQNREDTITEQIVPPCNWELWQTPSWLNYFMGRDHVSRRFGIESSAKVIERS